MAQRERSEPDLVYAKTPLSWGPSVVAATGIEPVTSSL